jgi:hypothetical protein
MPANGSRLTLEEHPTSDNTESRRDIPATNAAIERSALRMLNSHQTPWRYLAAWLYLIEGR